MSNKDLFELYGLNKLGTKNTVSKMCLCGEEMDISVKECPKCKASVPKSKMINVNRNSAIAKRFEETITEESCIFTYYQLMSNGLNLYETEALKLEMNKVAGSVTISNDKVFKAQDKNNDLSDFINKNFPGLLNYIQIILDQHQNEYAITKFTSLTASAIENVFYVYLFYHALTEYLMPYKILYFGKKVNLKKYFPDTDFNDPKSVAETGLNLELLRVWDIKNEKYIEKIIEISNEPKLVQDIITNSIDQMFQHAEQDYFFNYNQILESYGMLFNHEISTYDFIRIYQNCRNEPFCLIREYQKLYKKYYKKNIDWSTIEKFSMKEMKQLKAKIILLESGLTREQIEELYEILKKNPTKAIKYMQQLKRP